MSVTFEQLKQRDPAQVTFTGLGCWDVFKFGGRLAGTVAFDMRHPPFIRGDGKECLFAPGFVIFPMGLVETKDGWRTSIEKYRMSEERTADVGELKRYVVERSRGYGRFVPVFSSDDLERAKAACDLKNHDPFVKAVRVRDTFTKQVVYSVGSASFTDDPVNK